MKRLFPFNLVLLMCFGYIQWIQARNKMAVLEGDDLTKKIYESIEPFHEWCSNEELPSLELNKLNINSISRKSFGNLTKLCIMNLLMNNLEEIDSHAFSNLLLLEKVYLSKNRIKIIRKQLFQHNVRIKRLLLSYNRIAEIEIGAFGNLINLKLLYLKENPLKQLDGQIFSGNRKLTHLDLSNIQLKHLNESLFQNLTDLWFLYISGNKIVNISQNLFKNNNQLVLLEMNGNRIVDVHKNAFQTLDVVENLYLAANNISGLHEDCFSEMTALEELNLSNNKIKALSPKIFSRNTELLNLEINNNSITNLPPGLFKNNIQLRQLSLEQNQLTEITKENFIMLRDLTALNLARNKISHLDALAFYGLHKLRELDLQCNEIQYLPLKIFHKVSDTLEKLLLNNNKLRQIHEDAFSVGMRFLNTLNLGHNNLTSCHFYNCEYFPQLTYLYLNNNELRRVDRLFPNLIKAPALQNLYLEFNEIQFIYDDLDNVFSYLNQLKFMNISNNRITEFKPYFERNILFDITIDITNNIILRILSYVKTEPRGNLYVWESVVPLKYIGQMKSVDYYGHDKVLKINKKTIEEIECDDDPIIVSLVIHQNNLKQIDCLSKVWTLHSIDFSYNDLTNLTKKHFAKMIHLETLDISHNLLTSLDLNIFAASVKLTKLYIDECEVVYSWQYYRVTELFRNLTHISMQNNSIYCPQLSTIIQKFQNSNSTIKGYKKDDKILFESVDGIRCEDYKAVKDVLIVIVYCNNFLVATIIVIVLSIAYYNNNMNN